jgi:hypothetical protein
MAEAKIPVVNVDRPGLQESFGDAVGAVQFDGTLTKVEFLSSWPDDPGRGEPKVRRYPSCRLVLTAAATVELHARLQRVIALMEQKGILPKRPAGTEKS